MCLAIPLKLISVDGAQAVGEAAGLTRAVRVDFIKEPKVGDYVIVHAGFAIERLRKTEAEASLKAWREVADAGE
ncbi:MAG: HypC/HybG/HupF family hydrogenase formation chaperone [Eubacteriales bacterium]|nr:HypC/HybG/HupF family hydrogenase formation chaperone [Eubacteriales bacterium]